jgi:polysaccharide pyruvyl transferase CsaB
MQPNSILIVGNYGAGNLGDDAILGGIVTELRNNGFKGEIMVSHGGVESSREIYKGLKKVPFIPTGLRSRLKKGNRKAAEAAIQTADRVILGGGGLFVDTETWRAPFIWAAQAKAYRRLKKSYWIYGQSIGPLKSRFSRYLAKKTFKGAAGILLRDGDSKQILDSQGIASTQGADPAFSWLLEQKRKIPKKPVLLLSLRDWPGFGPKEWKPLIKEIQVFAKRRGLKPIAISMAPGSTQELQALKACGLELYAPRSALEAFEAFEKAQMAVTARLHAGIFALAAGTPCIALSYSKKVQASLEGSCRVLSGEEIGPESLRQALKDTVKNTPSNLESRLIFNQSFIKQVLQ